MLNKEAYARYLLFFVFLFLFPTLVWGEQEIEWGPSKAAKSYKLEIREFKTKKIKIDTKVKNTKYKVSKLDPGLYEYRIGIINDKDIIVVSSEWTSLSVIQSLDPEGAVDEVYYGGKNERFQEIFITGNNFMEDTRVEVFSAQGKIPLKSFVRISSTELKLTLDLTNAKEGVYDLKIINPLNKVFVKNNFYILGLTRKDAEKKIEEANRVSAGDNSTTDSKYFIRSVFIPGWGQYKSGVENESTFRKVKGGVFLFSFLGTGAYLAVQYRDYISQLDKAKEVSLLNNVVNYPYNPPLSTEGLYITNEFNTSVSAVYSQWRTVSNLSYALLGICLINLVDAYFFTGDMKTVKVGMSEIPKKSQWKAYMNSDINGSTQIGKYYMIEYTIRF